MFSSRSHPMKMIKHNRNVVYPLGEIFREQNLFLFKVANHLDNFIALECTIKLELCHLVKTSKPHQSERHFHPFLELTHVLQGNMFQKCDEKKIKIAKNMTFCMPPGSYHQWNTKEGELELLGFMLSIIPNNNEGIINYKNLNKGIKKNNFKVISSKKMLDYLKEFMQCVHNPVAMMRIETSSHALHGFFIELLKNLISKNDTIKNKIVVKDQINPLILRAKSMVQLQLGENISLEDISNQLKISKQHINRLFKQSEGVTLGEYILQQRLAKAKSLLSASSLLSIADISQLVGFQDSNYFSKFFKKRTGIKPHDFRN
ncbi:MAG: hypothetical protein COA79_23735 [Planctomycetota bacterium]|nr:MAG: hypothetical protein COA79_23735 [Planctomycetota bacterium]